RLGKTPPTTAISSSPAPASAGSAGPKARSFGARTGAFPAAVAIRPADANMPTAIPATTACFQIIDASSGDSVVGGVLEVHGIAEREPPVPTVVLPDRRVVPVDRRRALAQVLLGRRHVDGDPERVGAPLVGVAFRSARVPVDPVLDVGLKVGVLDVPVDVVVQVGRLPALVRDHRGRTTTKLSMEAERVRHPVVRSPPPHRDRPGLRIARLPEPVDDLRVPTRPRRIVDVLVPPSEPRPMERDDQRQHDRDGYRGAEEPEPSPSVRTFPHEPPPR